MTCSAIAAIAGAVTIFHSYANSTTPDTITLAPHPQYAAQVCYYNHEAQASSQGAFNLQLNETMKVTGYVEVGDGELVTVTPPAGYSVWPADTQTQLIPDGSIAIFIIVGGLS